MVEGAQKLPRPRNGPRLDDAEAVLDVGCGAGAFLATQRPGRPLVGIDISLEWLVVARRFLSAAGVTLDLAAAHAETLPLRDRATDAIVALDVIEHVGDQEATLREVDRVLAPGGTFAAATPHRFSLAAEPHVGVFGAGWLPRRWQPGYVRRRTGRRYDFVRLLSHAEATPHAAAPDDVACGTRTRHHLRGRNSRLRRAAQVARPGLTLACYGSASSG
ncbi:MAG: class I SAM-dependent methyltransferase [Longimicrobiaceae bacterium]